LYDAGGKYGWLMEPRYFRKGAGFFITDHLDYLVFLRTRIKHQNEKGAYA
jgi:hypothetical protein